MTTSEKKRLIKKHSPRSPLLKNTLLAFIIGGFICALGEALLLTLRYFNFDEKTAQITVTLTFIFLASLFTALGIFDKIARHAGAGTLVPVTGFSNAVTSEAMDSKSEGIILGVGAKIFTVAGPVILYGLLSGILYGVIYYALTFFGVLG